MAAALPLFTRFVALAAGALWLAAPTPASAEAVSAKLRVSAQVVVSCRLDASVPRVGTPDRARGTASFSVSCTRGASAHATACEEACAPAKQDGIRTEYRVADTRGDGTTVATILF
jgi:hypothetical protein